MGALRADLRANPRDPKAWLVLGLIRFSQALMGDLRRPRPISWPMIALSRFVTEFMLGIELRPTTKIGPGLTLYHGTGLVVNDHALIGAGVRLRNGVVIGNKGERGTSGCPTIGDGVDIGANAVIIGPITIGEGAAIGAGAVVIRDVPAGAVAVGNPARVINQSGQ